MIVFLIYGYRGLGNGEKHGYWIGLLFLIIASAASIYRLSSTLYRFLLSGSNPSQHRYLSQETMLFDVTVQVGLAGLFLGLLLRFGFGKTEKTFFLDS